VASSRLKPPTLRVALLIAAAIIVGLLIVLAGSAVTPFALGILLFYLLAPPVDRLAGLGIPRALSILIVYALVVVVVYVLLLVTLTPLLDQLERFATQLPSMATRASAALSEFYTKLDIPPEIRRAIESTTGDVSSLVRSFNPGSILPVVSSVAGFVVSLFGYAILPAWLFFLLKDRPSLQASFERSLPTAWRPDAGALARIVNRVVGQWIRGQVVLGLTVGIASYIGLEVLGATVDPVFGDFAILLAVISGLLELIPIIGPIIAAVPAVIVGLGAGPQGPLAVLALYFVIQQVENNVLVPKIQSDAVRLHPSVVIFCLVVGGAIGGLFGAIVSLPLAAMGRDIVVYLFHRLDDPPMSVADATDLVLGAPPSPIDDTAIEGHARAPAEIPAADPRAADPRRAEG
jgi:predicted PurR-regulated permease PerM